MPSQPSDSSHSDIPFDAIVEQAVAGIYIIQDEMFVYCNHKWAEILGYPKEEVIGQHLSCFVPPEHYGAVRSLYYQRMVGETESVHFITWGRHRLGNTIRIEVQGSRVMYRGKSAVMGVGIDITDRLKKEAELNQVKEQLLALTAYTNEKLETQRIEFARDIHDQIGGMLTALKMDATRILRRSQTDEMRALTHELIDSTQKAIDTVREISHALSPSELDHLALATVIQRDLEVFSERYGVRHTFRELAQTTRLTPRSGTTIYRVFREAMTNVARHSAAENMEITLAIEGDHFVFTLIDDGVGFDSKLLSETSLGLRSMIERSREIGALLRLDSRPGAGTHLSLTVPLI
jgi:PAS domain S-box-containing protein